MTTGLADARYPFGNNLAGFSDAEHAKFIGYLKRMMNNANTTD